MRCPLAEVGTENEIVLRVFVYAGSVLLAFLEERLTIPPCLLLSQLDI